MHCTTSSAVESSGGGSSSMTPTGIILSSALLLFLSSTSTSCFARALIPDHFHLLVRTGCVPVSTVMRRLRQAMRFISNAVITDRDTSSRTVTNPSHAGKIPISWNWCATFTLSFCIIARAALGSSPNG